MPNCSWNASRFPSGVKENGYCWFLLCVNDCGWPAPSERVNDRPAPLAQNAMNRPSGLQTGDSAFPLKVTRVIVSRGQS